MTTRRYQTNVVPPAKLAGAAFTVDMRLTHADLAQLSPEQVQAVFDGVGKPAAAGLVNR